MGYGTFSHDGRLVALSRYREGYPPELKLFNVASGMEHLSIAIESTSRTFRLAFSPDDRTVVAIVKVLPENQSILKFWDVATGEEVASIASEQENLSLGAISPDGSSMAVPARGGESTKLQLHLIDLAQHRIAQTIVLDDDADVVAGTPAFSPDGKWIAVVLQRIPAELLAGGEPDFQDMPQRRIHLIHTDSGGVSFAQKIG